MIVCTSSEDSYASGGGNSTPNLLESEDYVPQDSLSSTSSDEISDPNLQEKLIKKLSNFRKSKKNEQIREMLPSSMQSNSEESLTEDNGSDDEMVNQVRSRNTRLSFRNAIIKRQVKKYNQLKSKGLPPPKVYGSFLRNSFSKGRITAERLEKFW